MCMDCQKKGGMRGGSGKAASGRQSYDPQKSSFRGNIGPINRPTGASSTFGTPKIKFSARGR